jgi:hypothetical protein
MLSKSPEGPAQIRFQTINHRVTLYCLGAAAAGASLLALVEPADAGVVVTKTHLPITTLSPVSLDINKDGIADFQFSLSTLNYHTFHAILSVQALTGGAVIGASGGPYASALIRGAKIGPSAHFLSTAFHFDTIERSQGAANSLTYHRQLYGKWGGNPPNRFLGVKFLIKGATHFGWVRLTVVTDNRTIAATITGFAYETVPNKPILAGTAKRSAAAVANEEDSQQNGSAGLGMLALGADGLSLWRDPR